VKGTVILMRRVTPHRALRPLFNNVDFRTGNRWITDWVADRVGLQPKSTPRSGARIELDFGFEVPIRRFEQRVGIDETCVVASAFRERGDGQTVIDRDGQGRV
jgi:hypothetical protein